MPEGEPPGAGDPPTGGDPPAGAASPPSPPAAPPSPSAPPAGAATRPDYIPESYWDATKGAVKADDLTKLFADHEARTKGAIADWSKHELTTSVKGLDDKEVTIDRDDPLVKALGEIAVKRGWGNDDVQPLVDMIATAQRASAEAEVNDFLTLGGGDFKKANARLEAVASKIATRLGYTGQAGADGKVDDSMRKAAYSILAEISSSETFKLLEKFVNAGSPDAATGSGAPTEEKDIAKRWYGNKKAS